MQPPPLPASLRIAPRESPATEITRRLLDFLLSGAIDPGARIPSERQLAEALAVGRSSVREAIKSLALLGLLDVRQGDGTYLSRDGSDLLPQVIEWGLLLGEAGIDDVLEARAEIETTVAGFAAARVTEEGVARLRELLGDMRAAADDIPRYVDADVGFHLHVAALSANDVFVKLVTSLQSLLRAWASRVLEHAGETVTSLEMHVPIVEAIAARDPDAARAAMRAHMDRAHRRLREAARAARTATPAA